MRSVDINHKIKNTFVPEADLWTGTDSLHSINSECATGFQTKPETRGLIQSFNLQESLQSWKSAKFNLKNKKGGSCGNDWFQAEDNVDVLAC